MSVDLGRPPGAAPRALGIITRNSRMDIFWRVVAPFRVLAEHGHVAEWRYWDAPDLAALIAGPEGTPRYDLVSAFTPWPDQPQFPAVARACRRAGVPLIADFTDDVFVHYREFLAATRIDGRAMSAERYPPPARWAEHLRAFDGFTVSNAHLAGALRSLTDRPIAIAPNRIDAATVRRALAEPYPTKRPGPPGAVVIGHGGSVRPPADCAAMACAWGRLTDRYPYERLAFVSVGWPTPGEANPTLLMIHPPATRKPTVVFRESLGADYATFLRALAQADIICCSVADTPFNRSKTPSRAWEAALCGAAVVASPALYGQTIEHGRNGLLAETTDEWEAALARLVEDEPLRRRLGDRLRRDVAERHSLDRHYAVWPAAWAALLAEIAGNGRSAS